MEKVDKATLPATGMAAGTVRVLGFAIFAAHCWTVYCWSKISIRDNGYEGIVVALPPGTASGDRPRLISRMKNLLQQSSPILASSTKGRACFRSAIFLVPPSWGNTWGNSLDVNVTRLDDAAAVITRADADIVVTSPDSGDHPYVLHHEGCGRPGLRMYLPPKFLMDGGSKERTVEFLRLWSEYRYGMFLEGGFEGDRMYPTSYRMPGETENRTTGCTGQKFGISMECGTNGQCPKDVYTSSLMDQHLSTSATSFCEGEFGLGPTHIPHSPSKHNLLCREEGTWLTLLRSPDFARGRNAAPKYLRSAEVSFRYVREVLAPKIVVVIETSAQMKKQLRYPLVKNAFSRFVYSVLPAGSELTLLTFNEEDGVQLLRTAARLDTETERIQFLEGQPLPEEASDGEMACLSCSLNYFLELRDDNTTQIPPSPSVLLITAQSTLNDTGLPKMHQKILDTETRLHVLSFQDSTASPALRDLTSETGGQFVHIGTDILGDLYKGLSGIVQESDVLISQEYLPTIVDETVSLSFTVEPRTFEKVRVYISGPGFDAAPLVYDQTTLIGPEGVTGELRKQEVLPAWVFNIESPQAGGEFLLSTQRKDDATSPVLITVTGAPLKAEDPIRARVWVEILDDMNIVPPPVHIFADVRKGQYTIADAFAVARIEHPGGEISELRLIDDGLGDTDITKNDGIYSHCFTNFTAAGFYNVYLTVTDGFNETKSSVITGPNGHCCGSTFTGSERGTEGFQREVGPVTFGVTTARDSDTYPPARVTDLRVEAVHDDICILKWTAVGGDYDVGVAAAYELKLFQNRSEIRHRFSGSKLELYEEVVETTPLAEYGRQLNHALRLPRMKREGLYYFSIRAVDEAGNAGEPSNAVPIWLERSQNASLVDCDSENIPKPEKINMASGFVPIASLILWMVLLSQL